MAEAVDAARLEEAAQIEEWGLVEGGHDIDISDIKVRPCCTSSLSACGSGAHTTPCLRRAGVLLCAKCSFCLK